MTIIAGMISPDLELMVLSSSAEFINDDPGQTCFLIIRCNDDIIRAFNLYKECRIEIGGELRNTVDPEFEFIKDPDS